MSSLFYVLSRKRSKPMRGWRLSHDQRSVSVKRERSLLRRHLIVPSTCVFLACVTTPKTTRLSFRSAFPSLIKLSLPDLRAYDAALVGTFAFSFRRYRPNNHRYKHHGVPFDDKLDACPSGVSMVRRCVSCASGAPSVSKWEHVQ